MPGATGIDFGAPETQPDPSIVPFSGLAMHETWNLPTKHKLVQVCFDQFWFEGLLVSFGVPSTPFETPAP